MSVYSAITSGQVDSESPLDVTLAGQWTDNLLAVIEGDASAPGIANAALDGIPWQTSDLASGEQMTTTNVLAATAGAAVGAVGTYALLSDNSTVTRNPGDTLAGSSLNYTNAGGSALGSTALGTWRLMGRLINTDTTAPGRASTWLRIS